MTDKITFGQPQPMPGDNPILACIDNLKAALEGCTDRLAEEAMLMACTTLEAANQAYGEKCQEMFAALQERDEARGEQQEAERQALLYIACIVSAKCMGLCELDVPELLYGSELILEIGDIKDGPKADGISIRAYKPAAAIELEQLRMAHAASKNKPGVIIQ